MPQFPLNLQNLWQPGALLWESWPRLVLGHPLFIPLPASHTALFTATPLRIQQLATQPHPLLTLAQFIHPFKLENWVFSQSLLSPTSPSTAS